MSHLTTLVDQVETVAGRIAKASLGISRATFNGRGPLPVVSVHWIDATKYPVRGDTLDRLTVTDNGPSTTALRIVGDPGDDYDTLLREALDFLLAPPAQLVETAVPL